MFKKIIKSIRKKLHVCYHNKPIISRYMSFHTREIIYECKCGHRQVERVTRAFSDPFPIETTSLIAYKEFGTHLNKPL